MINIGINGFGRMGRLAFRVASQWPEFNIKHINDPAGDATTFAHLLNFDSVHGRWALEASHDDTGIWVDNQHTTVSHHKYINETDWSGCDIVVDCSGKMKTSLALSDYFEQGVKKVVVSAPVKEPSVLNVVMGVNDHLYNPSQHHIVTAASCTTNCIAPVIKVIHEQFGIVHGSITTIHDLTNTQSILDTPHKDLRRARASGMNLIPTTTGSATAIAEIFPDLKGKLNGHAVRVPLANASLTDCVFEINTPTNADTINQALKTASETYLKNILGFETRPLVSTDYTTDPRSSIVDALSTLVVNGTHVKIYAWYDNEWGYVNRLMELTKKVVLSLN